MVYSCFEEEVINEAVREVNHILLPMRRLDLGLPHSQQQAEDLATYRLELHVCMRVYICMSVCACVCVHARTRVCVCARMHACVCVCLPMCVSVCLCECVCVFVCVCLPFIHL